MTELQIRHRPFARRKRRSTRPPVHAPRWCLTWHSESAPGIFEQHQSGPQRAVGGTAPAAARFVGDARNGAMRPSVAPSDARWRPVARARHCRFSCAKAWPASGSAASEAARQGIQRHPPITGEWGKFVTLGVNMSVACDKCGMHHATALGSRNGTRNHCRFRSPLLLCTWRLAFGPVTTGPQTVMSIGSTPARTTCRPSQR